VRPLLRTRTSSSTSWTSPIVLVQGSCVSTLGSVVTLGVACSQTALLKLLCASQCLVSCLPAGSLAAAYVWAWQSSQELAKVAGVRKHVNPVSSLRCSQALSLCARGLTCKGCVVPFPRRSLFPLSVRRSRVWFRGLDRA
jgi:hypothetical protein